MKRMSEWESEVEREPDEEKARTNSFQAVLLDYAFE